VLGDLSRGISAGTRAAAPMVKAPIEARQQRVQAERVRESELNAPRIDAAKDAFDLNLSLNPIYSNPNAANRMRVAAVGTTTLDSNLAKLNLPKIAASAREDMGLPETIKLNAKAFDTAMDAPKVSEPYNKARAIPKVTADAAVMDDFDRLKVAPLLNDTGEAAAVNSAVDSLKARVQAGANGSTVVDTIRDLRRNAQEVYNRQATSINPPSVQERALANANMGMANALETAIENSINDFRVLSEFREARALAGRINDYRRATNLATGVVDPQVLAKMAAEGRPLSGNAAKIANVAANFPENLQGGVVREPTFREKLTRSSAGGTAGALIGSVGGLPGAIVGGGVGAALGNIGAGMAARSMAKPGFQKSAAMPPDYRPIPSGLTPAEARYGPNQVVPYQPEVVGPSAGGPANKLRIIGYDQDGRPIYKAEESRRASQQGFTKAQRTPPFGPTVFESQRGLPNEIPQQIYQAQKNAELAQELRAAGERIPARGRLGGENLVFDAAGKLVPETPTPRQVNIIGAPTSLDDAVQKLSGQVIEQPSTAYKTMTISPATGAQPYTRIVKKEGETTFERGVPRAFDLTATEKIAWDKAKANLAEVAPGFKALTDKAIANKMMDQKWIEETIVKAKQKAAMQDEIAKRGADDKARRAAAIERDKAIDTQEMLEERLRAMRPDVSGKQQGPKTRAAKRNALASDNQNALNEPFRVEIRGVGSTGK
jgi:hypothetical protein